MAEHDIERPEDVTDDADRSDARCDPSSSDGVALRHQHGATPTSPKQAGGLQRTQPARSDVDGPVLPTVTRDETGAAWGEEDSRYSDDWYRSERPPHHG